jgi:hypothetical protein
MSRSKKTWIWIGAIIVLAAFLKWTNTNDVRREPIKMTVELMKHRSEIIEHPLVGFSQAGMLEEDETHQCGNVKVICNSYQAVGRSGFDEVTGLLVRIITVVDNEPRYLTLTATDPIEVIIPEDADYTIEEHVVQKDRRFQRIRFGEKSVKGSGKSPAKAGK